ncbi:MAG: terminase [Bacteroidales bacterium]|nr:terminase [Bacteroidales bacterium]
MTKKESENKKAVAKTLYMAGIGMEQIAEQVGVSRPSISRWCQEGGWREARAAQNITRPELVNKLLATIDNLIEKVNESDDPLAAAGLGDRLSKLASVIEKLDKKASIVDTIEVFMAFSKWLEYKSATNQEITQEFIRQVNRLQDQYIAEHIGK